MKSYKDPTFQDRVGRAAEAKQKALEQLKSKPPVDEALVAQRQAARLAREAAEREKRAAKLAAEQEAKAAKAAAAQAEIDRADAAKAAMPTEAELKAARDARYAARKSRK